MEEIDGDGSAAEAPVSHDLAIEQDHRPKDSAVVMGVMTQIRMQGYVTAFVADKILVIRRKQMHPAAAETKAPAVAVAI